MNSDFWHERWENNQIGFHQDQTNRYLLSHWKKLKLKKGNTVFVPMAGKSKDILWLVEHGYHVIAVELSERAIFDFFKENNLVANVVEKNHFTLYQTDKIDFYCGDFFHLEKNILSNVNALFDRASLVALPVDMRPLYIAHLVKILPSPNKMLLVTMEYPSHQMDGPPFSVRVDEVNTLYRTQFTVELLETFDVLDENQRFSDKGLSEMLEKVYLLTSK